MNMTTCPGEELKSAADAIDKEFDSVRNINDSEQDSSRIIIRRINVSIPKTNLLSWLDKQIIYPKIYWYSRNINHEIVCTGSIHTIIGDHLKNLKDEFNDSALLSDADCRYFGGLSFQSQITSPDWNSFSAYQFILPQFELVNKNDDETRFICNLKIDPTKNLIKQKSKILDDLSRLDFDETSPDSKPLHIESRSNLPDQKNWNIKIDKILNEIRTGIFKKLVLARESILRCRTNVNALSLLANVGDRTMNSYRFYFQPTPESEFFGISPERLFFRDKNKISVEAVAGTSHRGKTKHQEIQTGRDLLKSEKANREHRYVVKNLRQILNTLNAKIEHETQPGIMKLHQLQHLFQEITASLRNNTDDIDILTALHPTPAVGGYPGENALSYIENIEGFDRGWYAGPIGWIGKEQTEFAVAIRSGLSTGKTLHIYNGAGIVKGSSAHEEWAEIEMKFSSVIGLLNIFMPEFTEENP